VRTLYFFGFVIHQHTTCGRYVAEAFYSKAKGAQLINVEAFSGDVWVFDCSAEINATFKINGQSYPIHPLDLSRSAQVANGTEVCYGPVRVEYLKEHHARS
jgi:hypothetical protein